ncbi:hypothetical protein ACF1BQ_029790 [Bradyrhizobium sp. RDT10]
MAERLRYATLPEAITFSAYPEAFCYYALLREDDRLHTKCDCPLRAKPDNDLLIDRAINAVVDFLREEATAAGDRMGVGLTRRDHNQELLHGVPMWILRTHRLAAELASLMSSIISSKQNMT